MNLYEKAGDFILTIIQLFIGGVVLAGVMSDTDYPVSLYVVTGVVVFVLILVAFYLFHIGNKKSKNKKN